MHSHSSALRRCLEECDISGIRALWFTLFPGLPQPETDDEALVSIHLARTAARSVPLRLRAYSHRWLLDHGLPSQLPDRLRPRAERLYPRIVEAVGVSINFRSPILKPAQPIIERAMCDAIEECYADKRTQIKFIRVRMAETKYKTIKQLFGSFARHD